MAEGKLQWKPSATPTPAARSYFSMLSHNSRLYLFGGFAAAGFMKDCHVFDPSTSTWNELPTEGKSPPPIYLHSSVVNDNKMWVFGGNIGQEAGTDTNALYSLDLAMNRWTPIDPGHGVPSPRYGHAACVFEGKRMVVVGGSQKSSAYLRDAYQYQFDTRTWTALPPAPMDLAYHTLFSYNHRVYLFGGYNGREFNRRLLVINPGVSVAWEPVLTTGPGPTPRCGSGVALVNNTLWVFGGYSERGHLNDFYSLDLKTMAWSTHELGDRPFPRAYMQAGEIDGIFYIFGGYGTTFMADFRYISVSVAQKFDLGHLLLEKPPLFGADYILRTFSSNGISLGRKELEAVLTQLNISVTPLVAGAKLHASAAGSGGGGVAAAAGGAGGGGGGGGAYPFNSSKLQEVLDLGFEKDIVVACMKDMQKAGQDTTNVELVINRVLNYSKEAKAPASPKPEPKGVDPAKVAELEKKLAATLASLNRVEEDKKEMLVCKICLERQFTCALDPCGHTLCKECFKQAPSMLCPICQARVTRSLGIFLS